MVGFAYDVAHLLAGLLVLLSLMLLLSGPDVRAAQRIRRARDCPGAGSRLAGVGPECASPLHHRGNCPCRSRATIIPIALHRIVQHLGIHRTIETVVGVGPTMMLGIG